MSSAPDDGAALERLVEDVLAGAKYRDICPELVASIGEQELTRRRNFKEAVKATRNRLHQVGGAYFAGREDYAGWLAELEQAARSSDDAALREACRRVMSHHASTRERLPILDQFYTSLLADLRPIRSVLDIACGLNPLAIPWMPLEDGTEYYACDIYQGMMDFLDRFMALTRMHGHSQTCDVLHSCPDQRIDVAFLLKTIPCLEQIDKQAGSRLLHAINAQYLIVSFPARSLGGRHKGMVANYETHFRTLIAGERWTVARYEFATELVFVVRK
jgi:16S rRNA (guanine(1405)-N(7))-methyltransferase